MGNKWTESLNSTYKNLPAGKYFLDITDVVLSENNEQSIGVKMKPVLDESGSAVDGEVVVWLSLDEKRLWTTSNFLNLFGFDVASLPDPDEVTRDDIASIIQSFDYHKIVGNVTPDKYHINKGHPDATKLEVNDLTVDLAGVSNAGVSVSTAPAPF
jgi:hypothetical protein